MLFLFRYPNDRAEIVRAPSRELAEQRLTEADPSHLNRHVVEVTELSPLEVRSVLATGGTSGWWWQPGWREMLAATCEFVGGLLPSAYHDEAEGLRRIAGLLDGEELSYEELLPLWQLVQDAYRGQCRAVGGANETMREGLELPRDIAATARRLPGMRKRRHLLETAAKCARASLIAARGKDPDRVQECTVTHRDETHMQRIASMVAICEVAA